MEVKVLLFNIYTFYLLHPIMATRTRLCGPPLAEALKNTCTGRGYYREAVIPPTISRQKASSFLTESHPRRIRRRSGRIVEECCYNVCTPEILESYCMPRITTATPTTPAATSLLLSTTTKITTTTTTTKTSTTRVSTQAPIRDNLLTDYERPTNAGPFMSGEPTPTNNRISTDLIELLNSSVEVPSRTANNSRFDGAVQDSSDQDSLDENSETESESPTRATRRRTKKPKHRPPKKNKKERKKKKEKDRSNKQRNNSKKHRGDSIPDPTRTEQSSEQSRNNSRGKVNESQGRHNERNSNNHDEDLGTLNRLKQRIIDTLQNVNIPVDVSPERDPTVPQRFN